MVYSFCAINATPNLENTTQVSCIYGYRLKQSTSDINGNILEHVKYGKESSGQVYRVYTGDRGV